MPGFRTLPPQKDIPPAKLPLVTSNPTVFSVHFLCLPVSIPSSLFSSGGDGLWGLECFATEMITSKNEQTNEWMDEQVNGSLCICTGTELLKA